MLARVLPDPRTLPADKLAEWHRLRLRTEALIKEGPLKFFEANDGGQRDFLEHNDTEIQGLYFFAGNKSGKTTAAVIKCLERAAGHALWGGDRRKHLRWKEPTMGALFCEDFDTHRTDLLPRFFTWCPKELLADEPIEAENGEPARILFKNGTVIYLRTYQQGYLKHEGKDYDWVLCNEPFSRDIYTAIWRGFTATDGIMFIAATLLSQTWLYDEMQHPFIKVIGASMYENKWLSARTVRNYTAGLTESERQVRIFGRSSNLSGMIYPNFKDAFPFVVGDFEPVPWDVINDRPWPIIMSVDPHERKPLHIEWAYVSPLNEIIWFDWALVSAHDGTNKVFEAIAEKERSHHHPSALTIMDPNRGKAIQKDGRSWQEEFEAHDYSVLLGIDDVSFGHNEVADYLRGPNPRMRWTERCRGTDGPIFQMERYVWDDWVRGGFKEKDVKERPKDINKDWPDVHRYAACARLDYRLLLGENQGTLSLNGSRDRNAYSSARRESPIANLLRYRNN